MDLSRSALRSALRADGITVGDVSRVAESTDEPVFEVQTDDGVLFAKIVNQRRIDRYREVVPVARDVGMPNSRLVGTDPTLLVMDAARGRPVSQVLPFACLPGLWRRYGPGLEDGFAAAGRYLARLHERTHSDVGQISEDQWGIVEDLRAPERLEGTFTSSQVAALRDYLSPCERETVAYSYVHSDPTPHNIFYHDGDVTLIDVNLKTSAALIDCVIVDCGLELMIGRLPYARSAQYDTLNAAFWRGYRSECDVIDVDEEVVERVKLARYLGILEKYVTADRLPKRARITRYPDVRTIKALIADWDANRMADSG